MTIGESAPLILAWAAGIAFGILFYGGLWWSLQKGLVSNHPALWFTGSFVVRLSLALTGFYVVFDGDWRKLVAVLLGFFIARAGVTRWTRDPEHANKVEIHAPQS